MAVNGGSPAPTGAPREQCADAVLMVRPAAFGYNPDTAATNTFQPRDDPKAAAATGQARGEFGMVEPIARVDVGKFFEAGDFWDGRAGAGVEDYLLGRDPHRAHLELEARAQESRVTAEQFRIF